MTEIRGQVKSIIMTVLTVLLGIALSFIKDGPWPWIILALIAIAQVWLTFIKSKEETYYEERMADVEDTDSMERKHQKKVKRIRYTKKIRKLEQEAEIAKKQINAGAENMKDINDVFSQGDSQK